MLRRSAYKVAKWCWLYDIPVRWLTDKQLANGTAKGLTTHVQVAQVFKKSDHWDPGPRFPKDIFLKYVKEYLAEISEERDR
jgi:hypothetical protein